MKIERLNYDEISKKQLPLFLEESWVKTFQEVNNVEHSYFGIKKKREVKAIFGFYIKNSKFRYHITIQFFSH